MEGQSAAVCEAGVMLWSSIYCCSMSVALNLLVCGGSGVMQHLEEARLRFPCHVVVEIPATMSVLEKDKENPGYDRSGPKAFRCHPF